MKSVLIVSHGSRNPKTKEEVIALLKKLRPKTRIKIIRFCFLEIEHPSIPEGIKECIDDGATEVLLLMNFLNSGRHMDEDIPAIINEQQKVFPQVKINISTPVGQHEGIVDLFLDLINS